MRDRVREVSPLLCSGVFSWEAQAGAVIAPVSRQQCWISSQPPSTPRLQSQGHAGARSQAAWPAVLCWKPSGASCRSRWKARLWSQAEEPRCVETAVPGCPARAGLPGGESRGAGLTLDASAGPAAGPKADRRGGGPGSQPPRGSGGERLSVMRLHHPRAGAGPFQAGLLGAQTPCSPCPVPAAGPWHWARLGADAHITAPTGRPASGSSGAC